MRIMAHNLWEYFSVSEVLFSMETVYFRIVHIGTLKRYNCYFPRRFYLYQAIHHHECRNFQLFILANW